MRSSRLNEVSYQNQLARQAPLFAPESSRLSTIRIGGYEGRKRAVRRVEQDAIVHHAPGVVAAIEFVIHDGLDVVRLACRVELTELGRDVGAAECLRILLIRIPFGEDERNAVTCLAIGREIEARACAVLADVEDVAVHLVVVPCRDVPAHERIATRAVRLHAIPQGVRCARVRYAEVDAALRIRLYRPDTVDKAAHDPAHD